MNLNSIPLFEMLSKRMSWLSQRQQVIAQNIANADTPGYKPRDLAPVDFERLAEAASRRTTIVATNAMHLAGSARSAGPFMVTKQDTTYEVSPNGNAVVLEEQLMTMSQTVMDHRITAGLYAKHLGMLRTALGRG